ncbi:GGDEF domain-containing protein [Luteimonas vadosa]|uniref:GGDEF domain-containing protein n=1 Tax=Luteimonas vadosa TaxID=1165507 RepID=UPI0031E7479D
MRPTAASVLLGGMLALALCADLPARQVDRVQAPTPRDHARDAGPAHRVESAQAGVATGAGRQDRVAGQRLRHWQVGTFVLGGLLLASWSVMAYQQRRRSGKLRELVETDLLTRVSSRLHIQERAGKAIQQALLDHVPMSILMLDIDYFKRINDRFGHPVGDQVLRRVAHVCQSSLGLGDLIGRIGGEEFLVVCPGTRAKAAMLIADGLRAAVQQRSFDDLCPGMPVTISVGVAQSQDPDSLGDLIERADTALYRAKEAGRNRVACQDGGVS